MIDSDSQNEEESKSIEIENEDKPFEEINSSIFENCFKSKMLD